MIDHDDVILLCGSDPATLGALAHAIRMHNLTVDIARDGVEASEKLDRRKFSVAVVLDAVLFKGTTLVSYLQRTRPEILARLIVVSTGDSGLSGRPLPPDVFATVTAPVDPHALVSAIRECTRRERSQPRMDPSRPRLSADDSGIRL